jgi:hypothetical protein
MRQVEMGKLQPIYVVLIMLARIPLDVSHQIGAVKFQSALAGAPLLIIFPFFWMARLKNLL